MALETMEFPLKREEKKWHLIIIINNIKEEEEEKTGKVSNFMNLNKVAPLSDRYTHPVIELQITIDLCQNLNWFSIPQYLIFGKPGPDREKLLWNMILFDEFKMPKKSFENRICFGFFFETDDSLFHTIFLCCCCWNL